jgi:hypothetical protein
MLSNEIDELKNDVMIVKMKGHYPSRRTGDNEGQ